MRIAAILFILATLVVNFMYNNFSSLVLATLSFPVLLWLLLRRKKRKNEGEKIVHQHSPEKSAKSGFEDI